MSIWILIKTLSLYPHLKNKKKIEGVIILLIEYLYHLKFWEYKDNGMWEEDQEIHSSSVGICLSAFKESFKYFKNKKISFKYKTNILNESIFKSTHIIDKLEIGISNSLNTLKNILPQESEKKYTDMSLFNLFYPFNVLKDKLVLNRINNNLKKEYGYIRYKNDYYYKGENNEEAEWTMGYFYSFLSNNLTKEEILKYIKKVKYNGSIPELFIRNDDVYTPNDNTPLLWSESLLICCLLKIIYK